MVRRTPHLGYLGTAASVTLLVPARPSLPGDDPLYALPADIDLSHQGRILQHRMPPSPIVAFGLDLVKLQAAHQIKYRTTDNVTQHDYNLQNATSTVLTVLTPHNADTSKAPSYAVQLESATGPFLGTIVTQAELLLMEAALEKGRPRLLRSGRRLPRKQARWLCHPRWHTRRHQFQILHWIAETHLRHPTYAPELGAAVGGTVPNITNAVTTINKSQFAVFFVTGVLGLAKQYPELQALVDKYIKPQYVNKAHKVLNQGLTADIRDFFFQDVIGYFDDRNLIYTNPVAVKVLAESVLGQATPKIPFFWYKSVLDEISPVADTDKLVDKYCPRAFQSSTKGTCCPITGAWLSSVPLISVVVETGHEWPEPDHEMHNENCRFVSAESGNYRELYEKMSVEQKYDGGYCQVHINLNAPEGCIKIYSKSERGSTRDRIGLHLVIRDSLKLGTSDCKIKEKCILEGELLVWNGGCGRIYPFHRICRRLHGASRYPPISTNEHLMIMFHDLLLLDDRIFVLGAHDERRRQLQSLVRPIPGHAGIGFRGVIAFSSIDAAERLTEAFAKAITQWWEGLVQKACDDPYIPSNCAESAIKLKKDYIPGLDDSANYVINGSNHSAEDEQEIRVRKLRWTSFHIGCVESKEDVRRFSAKPSTDTVYASIYMIHLNRRGYFTETPFTESRPYFDLILDPSRNLHPKTLFMQPFPVELVGAGSTSP